MGLLKPEETELHTLQLNLSKEDAVRLRFFLEVVSDHSEYIDESMKVYLNNTILTLTEFVG